MTWHDMRLHFTYSILHFHFYTFTLSNFCFPTFTFPLPLSQFHFYTFTFTISQFNFHTFTFTLSHFTFTFHTSLNISLLHFTFTLSFSHFHFHTFTFTPFFCITFLLTLMINCAGPSIVPFFRIHHQIPSLLIARSRH